MPQGSTYGEVKEAVSEQEVPEQYPGMKFTGWKWVGDYEDDEVIGMQLDSQGCDLLIVSERAWENELPSKSSPARIVAERRKMLQDNGKDR